MRTETVTPKTSKENESMSLFHACPKCGDLVERRPFAPVRTGRLCDGCVRVALEPIFRAAAQAIRAEEAAAVRGRLASSFVAQVSR